MVEDTGKYQLSGFVFVSEADYNRALKEYNNILGIQDKMNVDDIEGLKVVFTKLVNKNYFRTPIGINFLYELRDYIVKVQGVDDLPCIPVPKAERTISSVDLSLDQRYIELQNKVQRLQSVKTKLIIAVFAMAAAIIGMLFIAATNDNVGYFNAEEKVLDKYSAWQEELSAKEKELKDLEDELLEKQQ